MEYLINHFQDVANIYTQCLIQIYLFLTAVLFAYWLKPFVNRRRAAYLAAFLYWIFYAVNTHLDYGKDMERIVRVGILLTIILVTWRSDLKRNPIQKAFLCILFHLISWLSMEVLIEVSFFMRDILQTIDSYMTNVKTIVLEFFFWGLMEYGLMLLLLYAAIRILHGLYKNKSEELSWQEFAMLLLPAGTLLLVKPIMASYFLLWMQGIENGSILENIPGSPYRLFFSIFSLCSVMIVIALYQMLKEKQEEEFARRAVENQIRDTQRHVEQMEELYEKMRELRHDMGNHLTVMEGLAESGKRGELADYAGQLRERFDELQPAIKSGNAVTDILLSEVCDRCVKENIMFECHFAYPSEFTINPFDMSVILTNALQNAMEAATATRTLPTAMKAAALAETTQNAKESAALTGAPRIEIRSSIRENFFLIVVRNTTQNPVKLNEEGLPYTTKNGEGHGYGLKNIRRIARQHRGDLEIVQEETDGHWTFVLNVMLMGR